MGAVAVDYVNKPSNNANYKGSGAVKAPTPPISATASSTVSTVSVGGSTLGKVLNFGKNVAGRANLVGMFVQGMDYINDKRKERLAEIEAEYAKLDETQQAEKEALEQAMAYEKGAIAQEDKAQEVKQEAGAIADSVTYAQGQTLPSVLSQNSKALTQSLNTLTTTMNEQFALLNNYMMANLIVQGQFLELKTLESGLKVESMEYDKENIKLKDLEGNSIADPDNGLISTPLSPRDIRVIRDTTLAKDTTDKINFEIPEELESELSSDLLDISDILGYPDGADIFKEYYSRLGGVGL